MPVASALAVGDAVWALLQALPNLNTYDGEVPNTPPLDPDGRVHPYAVLYRGAGQAQAVALCGSPSLLVWSCQVTCVGGDPTRCAWAVDHVRSALAGVRLTVAGQRPGLLQEVADAGPIRRDDDVQPPRHYVPLLYGAIAT